MNNAITQPSLLLRVRDPQNHAAWREFDEKYRGLILGYCRARGGWPGQVFRGVACAGREVSA